MYDGTYYPGLGQGMEADYAKALTTSLLADMARTPTLERAITRKEIGGAQLTAIIKRDLERELRGEPGVPLFPNMRALVKTELAVEQRMPVGLSQDWGSLIGAIVPALAKVATAYVVGRQEASTATTIANLNLQSQALQLKSMDLQASVARANAADAAGVPGADASMPGGTLTPAQAAAAGLGIPSWLFPVGATAAAALAAFIAYRMTR